MRLSRVEADADLQRPELGVGGFNVWHYRPEYRKTNLKYGSPFGPVVASDLSVVVLDYAISRAKSKASAFSHRLRGVKRIEDALGIPQSRTGIGELDDHFVLFAPERDLETPGANLLYRVHGVFDNLKKCLQELVRVAEDAR